MPTKKKKFIDKKNAITFHLVHRSQQDPLAADETAPQHVLLAQDGAPHAKRKRKEEQVKFGVYYDDDYDYLQHLKDIDDVPYWEPVVSRTRLSTPVVNLNTAASSAAANSKPLQLPSSVFASEYEEKIGLLNKAAPSTGPRPDWDPEIVAALDDDFDFNDPDNELEDDFVAMALKEKLSDAEDDDDYENIDSSMSEDDEQEEQSRFTNYSISSSVLPRSEILQTLDERFEKMFAEYDEDGLGSLEGEEVGGYVNPESEIMQNLIQEFDQSRKKKSEDEKPLKVTFLDEDEVLVDVLQETKRLDDKWDCESIISTYSNLYNHPKLISERSLKIEINEKTGLPMDVLQKKLTKRSLDQLEGSSDGKRTGTMSCRSNNQQIIRSKDETPEEKKERKKIVKELRKERRNEKKANKDAFKEENKRQKQILMNVNKNLSAIKLV